MKNTLKLAYLLILCISISSCKKEVKKATVAPEVTSNYSLDQTTAKIGWTAYKTTDKIAVKGEFQQVTIKNTNPAVYAIDAINGTEFSIPVSSLFSNNDERDPKLKEFFFGVMKNTTLLSGNIAISNETTGNLTVTMNAITKSIPFTYTLVDTVFTLSGVMNLDHWESQSAIVSLNKACLELHKAADGISKTWNDVQIDASISIVKK